MKRHRFISFGQIEWGILKLHASCLGSQQEAEPLVQGYLLMKSSSISAAWSMFAVPQWRSSLCVAEKFRDVRKAEIPSVVQSGFRGGIAVNKINLNR
jgi:hypothetical protein